MERIRAEINAVFTREFLKLNKLVDELDRKLTDVMGKQAAILANRRKRIDGSTANTKGQPEDSRNDRPENVFTPEKPVTTFFGTKITTSQTIPSRAPEPSNP